jgi:hypothetical protein
MRASGANGGVRGNGSARAHAGAPWNGCGNESGGGKEGARGVGTTLEEGPGRDSHECRRGF